MIDAARVARHEALLAKSKSSQELRLYEVDYFVLRRRAALRSRRVLSFRFETIPHAEECTAPGLREAVMNVCL